jgi:hypothetical protein
MFVDHLDFNSVDANTLSFRMNGRNLTPFYAGPVRNASATIMAGTEELHFGDGTVQIEAVLPQDVETGTVTANLLQSGKEIAGPVAVDLKRPRLIKPRIARITNAVDGGLDVYLHGLKSNVRIFLEGLGIRHHAAVQVLLGGRAIGTAEPVFVPGAGLHMAQIGIPAGTACGPVPVRVRIDDFITGEEMISVRKGTDPAEKFPYKLVMAAREILSRFC